MVSFRPHSSLSSLLFLTKTFQCFSLSLRNILLLLYFINNNRTHFPACLLLMLWPSDKEPHRCKARERSRTVDCLCQLLSSILVKIKATQDIVFKYFAPIERKLPKVSGPNGLDTIREYKQFSIMFFFVITYSLYSNEKQFSHSAKHCDTVSCGGWEVIRSWEARCLLTKRSRETEARYTIKWFDSSGFCLKRLLNGEIPNELKHDTPIRHWKLEQILKKFTQIRFKAG